MKKQLYVLLFVFISVVSFGQRKYAADRYFKEFAYKKAAELYASILDKGDDSYLVLSRLADAQYLNFEFLKAEKNYKRLMDKYASTALSKHIFRYAQVLKTNGKVAQSDSWLLKLKDKENDSRALALENNKDYFVEYTNKPKTFIDIHNIKSNTEYSDFGGFIFNNNLYYASTKPKNNKDKKVYKWNNQPYLNIYKVTQGKIEIDEIVDVNDDSELLNDLSTKYHESNIVITKDGKTAYFTRDNFDGKKLRGDKDQVSHLKIYKAERIGDSWKNVKELPFNGENFSTGHPALSPDEKTLYFASDMPNGFGGTDIYKVSISKDGSLGKPENLGNKINTEGREMFPFIGGDNTLFFASNGHLGLGALDVFESKLENGKYTAPVNLGAPINGPYDDFAFVINNKKTYGFFSSNRKGGKGDDDIYSFNIFICKEDIKGIITDSNTGKPIENATVQLMNANGEPVAKQVTRSDGAYLFERMDCELDLVVVVSKEDYRNDTKNTKTLNVNDKSIVENLQLTSLIVKDQIVINPIYFDFDLYNIREDAEYELEHIVSVMKNNPNMVIKIESHTDSRGTKEYNRSLSDKRAKSTRDYIISRGIAANRIESAIGYGEDQLLNNCNDKNQHKCSKEEHQKNRRSYFYIVKGGKNVKTNN